MTTAADDRAAEEAFEASLAGRAVPGEAAGLAAFTSAVRSSATRPGRPNAALAELLSTGLLTDQSSPSTRTAPAAGPLPSRSARRRTRRRFAMILPALLAKFLSAGAVAQAATGAGVVVVVVTGAGATGVLPAGAQQTFTDVTGIGETADQSADDVTEQKPAVPVEGGDKLLAPDELPPTEGVVPTPVVTEPVPTAEELAEKAWLEGPVEGQTFGQWVSTGRENGWATGAIVSEMAHKRNEAAKAAREAARAARGSDDADQAEDGDEAEVEDESDDADEQESETRSSHRGSGKSDRGSSSGTGNDGHGGGNGNRGGHGNGKGHGED